MASEFRGSEFVRWAWKMMAVIALTALTACGSTASPADPSSAGARGGPPAAGGRSTAETCAAIKAVRVDLLSALLEISTVTPSDPVDERQAAADEVTAAVAKAIADLQQAGAETGDATLRAATADFTAGLNKVMADLKAAGTDIEKITKAPDNDQANAAEHAIIATCLDD